MKTLEEIYNCSKELGENVDSLACICSDIKNNISIYAHFWSTKNITDDLYIKIFNNYNPSEATKCCRLKIFKIRYKNRPSDDYLEHFELSYNDKEIIYSVFKTIPNTWKFLIERYMICLGKKNKKTKHLLNKYRNNIPDYTKL